MATLVARFVDSVTAARTVRMNLNDGALWRLLETSRFDPPRAKYARVSTLLSDGAIYPASAYDDRVLELRWLLDTGSVSLAADELRRLARELDRPGNILEYQPVGAPDPVFFRTHRIGLDQKHMPTDGSIHDVDVNVPAEPFAVGLEEVLAAVVVSNDPAGGMFFDVSGVKGDVETPLLLRVARSSLFAGALSSVCAVRRRGTPSAMPLVLQCEAMTLGTDTTLPGNDAAMSGSGSNYARCSFATQTARVSRLHMNVFPAAASVDARGTYQVYLRKRQSVADPCTVLLRYGASDLTSAGSFSNDVVSTTGTNRKWIYLGLLPVPAAADPVCHGYSGTELAVRGVSLDISVGRTSGTTNFDMDALLLVPADDRYAAVKWSAESLGSDNFVLDEITDMVYALEGTTEIRTVPGVLTHVGKLPMASPGVTNRYVWMINAGENNQNDAIGDTTTITPYYWPRYL